MNNLCDRVNEINKILHTVECCLVVSLTILRFVKCLSFSFLVNKSAGDEGSFAISPLFHQP